MGQIISFENLAMRSLKLILCAGPLSSLDIGNGSKCKYASSHVNYQTVDQAYKHRALALSGPIFGVFRMVKWGSQPRISKQF